VIVLNNKKRALAYPTKDDHYFMYGMQSNKLAYMFSMINLCNKKNKDITYLGPCIN